LWYIFSPRGKDCEGRREDGCIAMFWDFSVGRAATLPFPLRHTCPECNRRAQGERG
jgi:hypothetical protein